MKKLLLLLLLSTLCAGQKARILVGSPIRQKPTILKEFLTSLDELKQETYELDFMLIDDNTDHDSKAILNAFINDKMPTHDESNLPVTTSPNESAYVCNEETHFWTSELMNKVGLMKDKIIETAREHDYDYLFLIDSDLILHPNTLNKLIEANKPILSNIFWTKWNSETPDLPQIWLTDQYTLFPINPGETLTQEEAFHRQAAFLESLRKPGVYEVGGLGACTLIRKDALAQPISFKKIKNLTLTGEDRDFCVRACALGIPLFVDTHYPALHLYRESELAKLESFKTWSDKKPQITLSMVVHNEANRYLKETLLSVKDVIDNAVIIDDASTDNTVQVCRELLKGIPLHIIRNCESKFSNEVELRKQQWNETIKTNPDWILNLDADEVFEKRFVTDIKTLITAQNVDVFCFRLFDFWNENEYREDTYWHAHTTHHPFLVRYRPTHSYTWSEKPHHCGRFPASIMLLNKETSQLRLKHYGWATLEDRKKKYERYKKHDPDGKYGILEQYNSILDDSPHLVAWSE